MRQFGLCKIIPPPILSKRAFFLRGCVKDIRSCRAISTDKMPPPESAPRPKLLGVRLQRHSCESFLPLRRWQFRDRLRLYWCPNYRLVVPYRHCPHQPKPSSILRSSYAMARMTPSRPLHSMAAFAPAPWPIPPGLLRSRWDDRSENRDGFHSFLPPPVHDRRWRRQPCGDLQRTRARVSEGSLLPA